MLTSINLSKRQQLLINRLQNLEKSLQEELPVMITDIIGFGSFFRGKKNPKDVDLTVRYSNINPIYTVFKDKIKEIEYLYNNGVKFNSFKEAFIYIFNRKENFHLDKQFLDIFCNWLDNIPWNEITKGYDSILYNHERLTKKILERKLPFIKIEIPFNCVEINHSNEEENFKNKNRSSFVSAYYCLIWTKHKSNIISNILEIFSSPNEIRNACLIELRNFGYQTSLLEFQKNILSRYIPILLKTTIVKNEEESFDNIHDWISLQIFNQKIIMNLNLNEIREVVFTKPNNLILLDRHIIEKIIPEFHDTIYLKMNIQELQEIVEIERKRINELQKELYVLDEIIYSISHCYKNRYDNSKLFVAYFTLTGTQKKLVKEAEIRHILRKYDLPEKNIESVIEKRQRTIYRIK